MPDRLVLVGMMGAGKSTVGRALADALDWGFVDVDAAIEERCGATAQAIFDVHGEAAFREQESLELAEVLRSRGPVVISAGGGAVLDPANRTAMAELATVVWLRARPATLAGRVGGGGGRPLLSTTGTAPGRSLVEIDAERRPLYGEVADSVVDVDDIGVEDVVDTVLGAVHLSRVPRA